MRKLAPIEAQAVERMRRMFGRDLHPKEIRMACDLVRPYIQAELVTRAMAKYGWSHLWYANPFKKGTVLRPGLKIRDEWEAQFGPPEGPPEGMEALWDRDIQVHFGPRWHVGVRTGPDKDLICLRDCETKEEAEKWKSPAGWTPRDAVRRAIEHIEELLQEAPNDPA